MKLAAINCSLDEIATIMKCSVDTLGRRYADVIKEGRDHGKMSLKRKMFDLAMGGNVTMCIWLSKQLCGYTEKVAQTTEVTVNSEGKVQELIGELKQLGVA
jgi:hypothetical protein